MALERIMKVSRETLERLAALKLHPREPFNDVVLRLIGFHERTIDAARRVHGDETVGNIADQKSAMKRKTR